MNKILLGCLLLSGCIAVRPTTRINFDAPNAYPEGVVYAAASDAYYVTSARLGTVGKVTPDGAYTLVHADSTLKSTYGIKLHPDGKRLFVCVSDANYSKYTSPETRKKMARLVVIDMATGKKSADINLESLIPGKHFANDLTFDDKGNAYITDSYAHAIYKVDANNNATIFSQSKMFETEGVGINGIVYHPGGFLLVDNTNTGCLYKVDINNPQNIEKVKTEQFFLGADGLLLNENDKLTMVVNGGNDKIYQLKTEDNWKTAKLHATTLIADRFTYPSTATIAKNEVWVMNAKFNELVDSNNVPSKTFAIQHAVFKPLPR